VTGLSLALMRSAPAMKGNLMVQGFQLIALTPPGLVDASIAIAACRAGGLGVLDLEYTRNASAAIAAIAKLAQHAKQACGIKIDANAEEFVADVSSRLPEQIKVAILTAAHPDILRWQVHRLRSRSVRILLEITHLEQALLGAEMGVDGLIAKGQEAGGWVGEETSFILLQKLMATVSLPVWVQGGIGLHTAAACYAAGAAGVVLDAQLALTRESPLPQVVKASIAEMDGSETACVGNELGELYRVYARPGQNPAAKLHQVARALALEDRSRSDLVSAWRQEVQACVGWESAERSVWPLGQDAAFAAPLAQRFRTVGGVLEGMRQGIDAHVRAAQTLRPLEEAAPLARSHATRYPIVQGPMTRVSDTAAFALRVAEGGALPFLALALMRAPEVKALLEETHRLLGDHPWGVGILGFVPLDLRQEQIEVIRAYRPPFALIAGGRPDQARMLEQEGIPTYLHVPSPGLLKLFVESGARRFVFEGRECGGHVGPRSSFVLWNTMVDALLESLSPADLADRHVLFAGGVHNAVSAAMVATLAAPLVEQGVRIGVLLGTAYLFTAEAVATGAITEGFQQEAIRCTRTVLLETGPGHATRCAETPYAEVFERERERLSAGGNSAEEIRGALEELNLGRLRIASKGISRHPGYAQDPRGPKFMALNQEEQRAHGMYMLGQAAVLRDSTCTIEQLHREVSVEGSKRLAALPEPALSRVSPSAEGQPSDVAIVGMACLLPKAPDLQTYWQNILNKVDAITEVPEDRWDWRRYFDSDPKAPDKIYSKWGGFLEDVPFDPARYGMPPNTLPSIEPLQLLTLEVVRAALRDAGYLDRPFPRQRTSVILGVGGGAGDLGQQYAVRSGLPMLMDNPSPEIWTRLPEWTEDSFAGILLNVAAGRVANRFDLGGVNYTVDAACASSLAAVYLAARELEAGTSDMVLVGGADTVQNPFAYLCFSKTHALSPSGRCRTFDEKADGIAISEGIAMLVLKRLADAERDGDRVYAVIKSVAGSSDGRDKGLTAPRPEGQAIALERAYAKAGFSPASVGLIEAHGTGTVAGDQAEVETLKRVFGDAGLIKIALALYHKVLPPTINVATPNSKARFPESPFYVNTEPRPWIHGQVEHPRRAGVSAFGFGGTNFHAVVEEYAGDFLGALGEAASQEWPCELLLWAGDTRQEILAAVAQLEQALARGAKPVLRDLAYTLCQLAGERTGPKLAVVAASLDDLRQKLVWAQEALQSPDGRAPLDLHDPRGIYFAEKPLAQEGRIAFLFSGQGSQYPDMLRDLAIHFPEVRERFELADRALADRLPERLSFYVFPRPHFSPEEQQARQRALTQTNIAQPALGAAGLGLCRLLQRLGVQPDMLAGHSYGEYVALCSAGVWSEEALYNISEARGRCIIEASGQDLGTMAAVTEGPERIADVLKSVEGVWIANINAPRQTVISGTRRGVEQAIECLANQGIQTRPIPVACAFHSPVIAPARDRLAMALSAMEFSVPQLQVFSNASAAPYPGDSKAIAALLAEHLISPVRFANEVEAMFDAGARLFVEVGPRNILASLTGQILADRPHIAIASDTPGRSGLLQLLHVLAQLAAHGVPLKLDRLYQGRSVRLINLATLDEETREKPLAPTTWLVNGGRVRPLREASMPAASVSSTTGEKVVGNGKGSAPAGVVVAPTARSTSARTSRNGPSPVSASQAERQPLKPSAPASEPITPGQQHDFRESPHLPARDNEAGRVMLQFQHLMNRFLETQQQVMLAYLRGSPGAMPRLSEGSTAATLPNRSMAPAHSREPGNSTGDPPLSSPGSVPSALESPTAENFNAPAEESQSPAESSAAPPLQPVMDREHLTQSLLQIVSERTGYPSEMLPLDQDLEADLGIDSIKRVEILGAFQRACLPSTPQRTQAAMERLTGIKTLRGIVEAISSVLQTTQGVQQPIEPPSSQEKAPTPEHPVNRADGRFDIFRSLLTAVDVPLSGRSIRIPTDRVFLITDDEQGVAHSLAHALRSRGGRVALVKMGRKSGEMGQDGYTANLTDPTAVAEFLEVVRRQQGPLAAIIHLLPLMAGAQFDEMDLMGWRDRLRLEVMSLFYLAKSAGPDLRQAGEAGGSWLVAATSMGGMFASDVPVLQSFLPSQGGVGGLIKTLALEWPQVQSKVIDLDLRVGPAELAERLLAEIETPDDAIEVGYRGSRRIVLRPKLVPLSQHDTARLAIDSSWVMLVTGGARGITAEIACELAKRYRPTLIIVGRSPLPEPEEAPETADLSSPKALKAAIMDRMRRTGQAIAPPHVEAAYARLLQDREMRSNLAAMERAGATVRYYQLDVRDERSFQNLLDELYRSYGKIDGVIHGAGIVEDKLVEDKTPASFDRVFETKVLSAFILSRKLRPDSLKVLVFFASIAGRFGNRGQSDYAAANEILNKLAVDLDRRWSGRVLAVNWGPWMKSGMVSAEIERQFSERGVRLIPPSTGSQMLLKELELGRKGEVEIIVGDGPWETVDAARFPSGPDVLPLLNGVPLKLGAGGAVELIRTLDPRYDRYLRDHRLDGQLVFPMAMAMELMAEVVQQGWPEWEVVGIRSLQVLRGIVLGDGAREVRVVARPPTDRSHESLVLEVDVEIDELDQPGRPCYRATVQIAERFPPPPPFDPGALSELRPFPMAVEESYRRWLFHGPCFQGISTIEGMNEHGITAIVLPSSPAQCLPARAAGHWLIDPVLLDCGFQLAILWERVHHNMTPLPSRFTSYRRFGPAAGAPVRCSLQARSNTGGHALITNISFLDTDGRVVGVLEEMEFSCSSALNRLAGMATADRGDR
jgi:acyl transferase domain-containing protein/NAD(P)H-dependent flavin oxidoreductase YrpB (nitropropane dioxygenase family)/NAD(P)-dependent dehydrogenase (short-subunit alcohol dehydrogenase family)/acyl carrier protein